MISHPIPNVNLGYFIKPPGILYASCPRENSSCKSVEKWYNDTIMAAYARKAVELLWPKKELHPEKILSCSR
jgi:hypothetical protein